MPQQKSAGLKPALFRKIRWARLLADGCGAILLLDDAGRLAAQVAQVIQFRAAHLAAAHHLDRIDHRRHHRKDAFHAFAVGNLAHGKTLVEPGAGAADANTFIGLHARAIAFDHLDVDDHGVARSEFRNFLAGGQLVELLFFELLNEVHRKISIGGAPQPVRRGAARSSIYPAIARIWRSYTAKAAACHPSVVFFGRFWPGLVWTGPVWAGLVWACLAAHRSGRRALVRASASARRQAATRAWSPDNRISGIGWPSNSCGRVYWGYSRRPSEKLSAAPEMSFPITPGSSRTQASISPMLAISPPERTKSPIDTSSSWRASITRWSIPSNLPQTISGPGPAASSATRDWVNGRPRGLISSFGRSGAVFAVSIADASTSARSTMPGPPPAGVSSTLRCRSAAESLMSRASNAQSPDASALPARLTPSR